jgi:hypothetical protein
MIVFSRHCGDQFTFALNSVLEVDPPGVSGHQPGPHLELFATLERWTP